MPLLVNDNQNYSVDISVWEKVVETVLDVLKIDDEVNIVFTDEEKILKINKEFLNHHYVTDVISFENILEERGFLGEVYVCLEQADRQKEDFSHPLEEEVFILIAHGILHLVGYDDLNDNDRAVMFQKQDEITRIVYSRYKSDLEKTIARD